jgi:lipocalin
MKSPASTTILKAVWKKYRNLACATMAGWTWSIKAITPTGHVAENRRRGVLYRGARRAALKVSFFGPFYGGYNVIALDKDYRYALVCGPDRDYLWLLARAPKIPPEVKQQMLDIATRQGFDVSKLLGQSAY